MMNKALTVLLAAIVMPAAALLTSATPPPSGREYAGPEYTKDAQLKLPENYRQWVYLTTGFDMSYNPSLSMGHHMFDNVFVNPESYKSFVETGTWPDKTVLVLEGRMGQDKGSINQKGSYQGTEIMGIEAHVKDEARFPGKWAFFIFDGAKTAEMVPTNMECYTCHAQHAAVDNTFVQFYPTLLPIAQSKGTLSQSYQKETAVQQK
jgi:Cytochrome P460